MNDQNKAPANRMSSREQSRTTLDGTMREFRSEDLLQGGPEILIRHGKDMYRLRATSKGKLILTK